MMINPFDYLYYKIYKAWSFLNGGDEPIRHQAAVALLLLSNLLTIYIAFTGEFPPDEIVYGAIFIMGALIFTCYRSKREAKIVAKFEKESEESRIIGNWIVTLYAILSIVALFKV